MAYKGKSTSLLGYLGKLAKLPFKLPAALLKTAADHPIATTATVIGGGALGGCTPISVMGDDNSLTYADLQSRLLSAGERYERLNADGHLDVTEAGGEEFGKFDRLIAQVGAIERAVRTSPMLSDEERAVLEPALEYLSDRMVATNDNVVDNTAGRGYMAMFVRQDSAAGTEDTWQGYGFTLGEVLDVNAPVGAGADHGLRDHAQPLFGVAPADQDSMLMASGQHLLRYAQRLHLDGVRQGHFGYQGNADFGAHPDRFKEVDGYFFKLEGEGPNDAAKTADLIGKINALADRLVVDSDPVEAAQVQELRDWATEQATVNGVPNSAPRIVQVYVSYDLAERIAMEAFDRGAFEALVNTPPAAPGTAVAASAPQFQGNAALPNATVGAAYATAVQATNTDPTPVEYACLNEAALPDMTIETATGRPMFSADGGTTWGYTPAAGHVGTHTIRVEATDGEGETNTREYTLEVLAAGANQPPAFTNGPALAAATVGAAYAGRPTAADPDAGDTVEYELVNAAAMQAAGIRMTAAGDLEFTDAANPAGVGAVWTDTPSARHINAGHNLQVRITDGTDTVEQAYTLEVLAAGANTPPRFTGPNNLTAEAGETGPWVRAEDTEDDGAGIDLAFERVGALPGAVAVGIDTDGELAYTTDNGVTWERFPAAGHVGNHTVRVRVTDSDGRSVERNYTVAVNAAVNDDPVLNTAALDPAEVGQAYGDSLSAEDEDVADDGNLEFRLTNPAAGRNADIRVTTGGNIAFSDGAGGWQARPRAAHVGNYSLDIEVRDPAGATDTHTFALEVNPAAAPNIAPAYASVDLDDLAREPLAVVGSATGTAVGDTVNGRIIFSDADAADQLRLTGAPTLPNGFTLTRPDGAANLTDPAAAGADLIFDYQYVVPAGMEGTEQNVQLQVTDGTDTIDLEKVIDIDA